MPLKVAFADTPAPRDALQVALARRTEAAEVLDGLERALPTARESGMNSCGSSRASIKFIPRRPRGRAARTQDKLLTVEHRAAAMQGVHLNSPSVTTPLHSTPSSSTAIPNATPSRLLSISASPRFPRRSRQDYHATICRPISYRPAIVGPRKRHNE
jgi:hypothetical protein